MYVLNIAFYSIPYRWISFCRHKAHLGWNQEGGFSQETYNYDPMDDSVRALLRAAGRNPDRMTKDDLEFSKCFISEYQKVPQVQQPPPSVLQGYPRYASQFFSGISLFR